MVDRRIAIEWEVLLTYSIFWLLFLVARIVTVVSSAIAHFVALWLPPVAMLHVAVATWEVMRGSVPPPYMEPMFGLCWSMRLGSWRLLSLCWAKITACSFLILYPAQKEHFDFGSCRGLVGRIWSLCLGVYVDRHVSVCRLLEAILGPYLSHVELMLSQERRVPFQELQFWRCYALEICCGRVSIPSSVWVFPGELSSQSEKSIERDMLLKKN